MFLLFDVGGTHIRIGIGDRTGGIINSIIMLTPQEHRAGLDMIYETARSLGVLENITAVVGGFAGPFDRNHDTLIAGGNIKDWVGKPVKKMLVEMFRAPVYLENDAALAGLGEAVAGAGKDHDIVGYMTVSTGVGGARITHKIIDAHASGFEPGHQIISYGGHLYRDLESYIGGREIEVRYGKKGEDIHDDAIWDEIAHTLAVGLVNTIVHWSPDILVLGGSVMKSISIERLREFIQKRLTIYPNLPLIERAMLGDLGGLEGALHLARMYDTINKKEDHK